jgi:hypothetical protein
MSGDRLLGLGLGLGLGLKEAQAPALEHTDDGALQRERLLVVPSTSVCYE